MVDGRPPANPQFSATLRDPLLPHPSGQVQDSGFRVRVQGSGFRVWFQNSLNPKPYALNPKP